MPIGAEMFNNVCKESKTRMTCLGSPKDVRVAELNVAAAIFAGRKDLLQATNRQATLLDVDMRNGSPATLEWRALVAKSNLLGLMVRSCWCL